MRLRGAAAAPLLALLLLAGASGALAGDKKYFSFTVESRDADNVATRRGLLRNATLPLHGAVMDFG